jgi:nitrate reductase gamma subunit
MRIFLLVLAYLVYVLFWSRIGAYALLWFRAAGQIGRFRNRRGKDSPFSYAGTAGDLVLFGRLFRANPGLWLGAWAFHVSFLFVILRHLRYFMNPVPECIVGIQCLGLLSGYVLPLAVLYIGATRLTGREKYASRDNLFILGLVLSICITGLLMTFFFKPDLIDVKRFAAGIFNLDYGALPASLLFVVHFLLALLLLAYLPSHVFTATYITLEARRSEAQRKRIMHD